MLKAIKMALEYKDILPYAIKESAEDKKLSATERDRILKSFWALVNEYRAMKKRKAA